MQKNVVVIIDEVLGGTTYFNHVRHALEHIPYVKPFYFSYKHSQYLEKNKRKIPLHKRWKTPFLASYISDMLFTPEMPDRIDAYFFFSFELPISYCDRLKKIPSILAFDGTLIGSFRLKHQYYNTTKSYIEMILKSIPTMGPLKKMCTHIGHFFPLTSWCKDSLINDFNVPEDKITVAPGGYDTSVWKAAKERKKRNGKFSLILVGNDFRRKGGEFLLELFQKYFQDTATLTIVSNDPFVKTLPAINGVEYITGIRDFMKLITFYQQADLFVFPTRIEWMGHVLLEASLTGLPIVASDVGGVPEIVKDQYNGYLLPHDASENLWRDKIQTLIDEKSLYTTMRENALTLAKENFTREVFVQRLKHSFAKIGITEES